LEPKLSPQISIQIFKNIKEKINNKIKKIQLNTDLQENLLRKSIRRKKRYRKKKSYQVWAKRIIRVKKKNKEIISKKRLRRRLAFSKLKYFKWIKIYKTWYFARKVRKYNWKIKYLNWKKKWSIKDIIFYTLKTRSKLFYYINKIFLKIKNYIKKT
jgi:hypothetical protein